MKMRLAALGALIAAAATTACGRGTGTVRPLLTDAPAPANVQKVLITINEVRIKDEAEDAENRNEPDDDKPGLNGSPATHPEAEQDGVRGKGWIVLCTGLQTFDLLSLTRALPQPDRCSRRQDRRDLAGRHRDQDCLHRRYVGGHRRAARPHERPQARPRRCA